MTDTQRRGAVLVVVVLLVGALWWATRARGQRVYVVGAGVIAAIRAEDAPHDVRYVLDVSPHASFEDSSTRVAEVVQRWPDVVVIGLDAQQLRTASVADAQRALLLLTRQAENATAVPVVLSVTPTTNVSADLSSATAELQTWWRDVFCQQAGLRLCVDVSGFADAPQEVRAAVGQAVLDALVRQEQLRASTQ